MKEIKRGKSPTYTTSSSTLVFAQKCNVKTGGIDMSLAKFLDEKTLGKYPNDEFMQNHDIVINSTGTGTMGRIGLFCDTDNPMGLPIVPDSHVTIVRLNQRVSVHYLICCLQYYQPYLEDQGEGSTNQKELKPDTIKNLFIPLPSEIEQQRIADMVTSLEPYILAYGEKDTRLAVLNKGFPYQLKKSILQMAIQGKLVPQDPSDEPASVLLERIHAGKERLIKEGKIKRDKNESVIFRRDNSHYEKLGTVEHCIDEEIPFEIPDTWAWVRLGSVFQHNTGKALNASNKDGTKLSYITTSNLYWDRFELEELKEMFFTDSEIDKCTVKKGDLLVCEGGDIGRAAIWPFESPMRIQNHIHRLRPFYSICVRYFYYLFYLYKGAGMIGGKGIAIQGLSSNAIHNLIFPLPPENEQFRIVEAIENALRVVDYL